VKVLHDGKGSFNAVIAGTMYAGTPIAEGGAGADVINVSLGAVILDSKATEVKAGIRELTKAVDRAMSYAWKRGVTIVAATGNDAMNVDTARTAISLPAQSRHVISVSATGPMGWAYGNTDFARLASYANYGMALTDLSAPGGDFAYPTNELCRVFRSDGASITNPCWVFDMYLSTTRTGWGWAAGTSMASPVVAGVAALIIEKAGGSMHPSEVEEALKAGALDLGKPGKDGVYGHGWVNAYRSVR
jgi:subtilisin family serine protease